MNKNYSYIFEVLYPENRHNEGARLVVDYGTTRTIVGLALYDKQAKKELNTLETKQVFENLKFKMAKLHSELDLNQVIELQKTLPSQEEGFVIRFKNGLRVKFKTVEYIKMNKILNSLNVKKVWETMQNGKVPEGFMHSVPEEIREEIEKHRMELEEKYKTVYDEAKEEQALLLPCQPKEAAEFKAVALFMLENRGQFKYPDLVFPFIRNRSIDKLIMDLIKPS